MRWNMAKKNRKGAPGNITRSERQAQAVALRRAGYTYDEIAKTLGVGKTTAYRDVVHHLQEARAKTVEEAECLLQLERERLETLLRATWGTASKGDTRAINAALRVLDSLRKNQGLDKLDVSTNVEAHPLQELLKYLPDNALDALIDALGVEDVEDYPAVKHS